MELKFERVTYSACPKSTRVGDAGNYANGSNADPAEALRLHLSAHNFRFWTGAFTAYRNLSSLPSQSLKPGTAYIHQVFFVPSLHALSN